jgi:hypothetical protein
MELVQQHMERYFLPEGFRNKIMTMRKFHYSTRNVKRHRFPRRKIYTRECMILVNVDDIKY